ncbi:MAG: lysophospholipase [Acidobacteriota bacterium]|nr:lysophospholipase [Acidobacteriota bacterium]
MSGDGRAQGKQRATVRPSPLRNDAPEVVDPVWLLKALGICVVAAMLCGYATLCLFFYLGDWQLILHPAHTVDQTPAQAGLDFSPIRFDASETGQPRLSAWWIPAPASGLRTRYAAYTVLYLHDGSGSLSDTIPTVARLHAAGLNVFAFDYRGFGTSDSSSHPSADSMAQDTAAAFQYLIGTRHIAVSNILPYGVGLGASLAATLAQAHPELPAVILDNPHPDPASTVAVQSHSRIVPVRLLFGKQFDIATPIASLRTPKLLIAGGPNFARPTRDTVSLHKLFQQAAAPRFSVTLPPGNADLDFQAALARFLDQYLAAR